MSTTAMSARPRGEQLQRVGARTRARGSSGRSRRCPRGRRSAGSRARCVPGAGGLARHRRRTRPRRRMPAQSARESGARRRTLRTEHEQPTGGSKCRIADPPHISPSSSARCCSSSSSRRWCRCTSPRRRARTRTRSSTSRSSGWCTSFVLFVLIQTLAVVSGAHFNPAVTAAMTALRQIKPPDAAIYVVAQFARRRGRRAAHQGAAARRGQAASNYGAVSVSDVLDGKIFPGHGRRGARHVLPRLGDHRRGRQPARDQGVGRARDRRRARHGRDGVRPAHRRRLQPGARLRPRAGVGRLGRRRQLHPRLRGRPGDRRARRRLRLLPDPRRAPGAKGVGGAEPVG